MQGQVIGVNSAIAQAPGSGISGQSGNIGVGFAIPSDQVRTTVVQLIKTGKAVHPVIGVYLDSSYTGEGVRIADEGPNGEPAVNPDGPADRAGLEAGDVVIAFDGKPVSEGGELVVAIRARNGRREGHPDDPSRRERAGCHDGPRGFGRVTTRARGVVDERTVTTRCSA